jgi:stage III sporulation protein AE
MKKYFTAAVLVIIAIFSFPRQNVLAGEETSAQLLDQLYEEVEMDQIDLSDDDYFYQITGYNDLYSFLSPIISGEYSFDFPARWQAFVDVLMQQLKTAVPTMTLILAVALLSGFLQNLGAAYLSQNIQNTAFIALFATIALLLINAINTVMTTSSELIFNLSNITGTIVPISMVLLSLNGGLITQSALSATLILFIGLVTRLISQVIIPLSMFGFTLSIISNLSKTVDLSYFGSFIKKASAFLLGLCFVVFSAIIKAQGAATASLDGVVVDTLKFTANRIPLIGKFLTDSASTVSSFLLVIKNAFGFAAVVIILAVMLFPVIKILAVFFAVKISAVIAQPFVDKRVSGLLDSAASYLFFIGACTTAAGIMFISMFGIVSAIGNNIVR